MLVKEWENEITLSTCADSNFTIIESEEKPKIDAKQKMNVDDSEILHINRFQIVKQFFYKYQCESCKRKFEVTLIQEIVSCICCNSSMRCSPELKEHVECIVKYCGNDTYFKIHGEDVDPTTFNTLKKHISNDILKLDNITILQNNRLNEISILPSSDALQEQL